MKNRTLIGLAFACLPLCLSAQYLAGTEALNAQQFPEALKLFRQAGTKIPALTQLGMARYFSAPGNPAFHLDSAYACVLAGTKAYRNLDDKKQEAVKKEMGKDSPVKIRREIEKHWAAEVIALKDLQAMNRFLAVAKNALPEDRDAVTTQRDQLAYTEAYTQNTPQALYTLLSSYDQSLRTTNPILFQKAGIRLFEWFIQENGWSEQEKFKTAYPGANFARDTVLTAMKAAANLATRNRTEGWQAFARRYSGTVFEAIGLDSLSAFILQKGSLAQCEEYLKSWPNGPERNRVWERLYQLYRSSLPDPPGLQSFAARFPDFPFQERLRQDEKTALEFFYEATMRSDSAGRMARFLQSYPAYPKADSVWLRFYTLARARAKTPKEIETFLDTYPGMPAPLRESAVSEKKAWEDRIQLQIYERLVAAGNPTPLLRYATRQPPLKFAKEALLKLPEILLKSDSVEAIRTFLKALPGHPDRARVMERLYMVTNAGQSLESIRAFVEAYPDFDSVRVKVDRAEILMADILEGPFSDERQEAYSQFVKEYAPSDEAFFVLQKMMYGDFSEGNWQGVEDTLKQYEPFFNKNNSAFQDFYARALRKELSRRRAPLQWEDGKDYEGYSPELTANGKQLYFTRTGVESETEDVFYTQYSEKGWSAPVPVSSLNTPKKNEAVQNISANGTEMLLFVDGDIYESKKTAQGWKAAGLLPGGINTPYWDGDPRYFGKGLVFVSAKDGDMDIYFALYGADGTTLQKPFPIGDVINTWGDERNPFLHPDMKTLYFASDGHDGFGGFDIYMSTRLDDTWRNWSKPRNLGLLFNSSDDDWHFIVTTDGSRAYSVSDEQGDNHITYMDLPQSYRPEPVYTFETTVLDANGKPVDGEVVIQDLETGKIVQIVRPDPITGAVFVPVSEKKNYRAELRKTDTPPVSLELSFARDTAKTIVKGPVIVATTEDLMRSGASIVLNNLFFETGSYTLLDPSRLELDALAKYLKDNNLAVEIQGHTDDIGSAYSNQLLSENRASAVRDYLIARGCAPEKVQATGYGETRPAILNQDEQSRQKNRRVEFRLL
jgi:outer membrane protein OmpA-like peptidoglycan-associated protein